MVVLDQLPPHTGTMIYAANITAVFLQLSLTPESAEATNVLKLHLIIRSGTGFDIEPTSSLISY
ncbi:hypothetical protein CVS40_8879 [Lucilia cuprina]|nr:hypothetical protein CVS40_8879 [Lucilia cuprina]